MSKSTCPLMVAFTQKGAPRLIYCGKWSCPRCARTNAKKWARIALHGVRNPPVRGKKAHFWTFTMPSSYTRPKQAYAAFPRLWDTLRKAIQREQKTFTFIAFVEGQPERSFMPHFHVITFNTIAKGNSKRLDPLKWIKDFAVRIGFGHQAYDEIITGRKAAAYVAKYASKGTPEIPKNFRRVRCSRNWRKPDADSKEPYLVRAAGEQVATYLHRVADVSGKPLQEIADAYQATVDTMTYERLLQ